MKNVPTVQLVDPTDASAWTGLPEQVQLAMVDIGGAAREGLLAVSVAAGLAVLQTMLEVEVTEVAGPKGRHDPDRVAVRHASTKGSVALGGRRVQVGRPRAGTLDGHEVPLDTYAHFATDDLLSGLVLEGMLAGVATRRHARVAEPVGGAVDAKASAISRSAVSRRFVKQTETALGELLCRDLSSLNIKVADDRR